MVRLRKALDSPEARDWYAAHTNGEPFFFGRYTGRTPVPGTRSHASAARVERLRDLMREGAGRHERVLARVLSRDLEPEARYFLPSFDGAEMRSRWDMQIAPPDILITNYSMLSIALGRSDEQEMLQRTKEWIEADPGHVFTLVVDELHMYRGTAGSEVAYLLRRLLARLGLDERPGQLSVIGTSASVLDDEEGRQFFCEFFARSAERPPAFVNAPPEIPPSLSISCRPPTLSSRRGWVCPRPRPGNIAEAVTSALAHDGTLRARPRRDLAARLFPELGQQDAASALESLVRHLGTQPEPAVRLRTHMFARTLQGLWACCDPACTALDGLHRSPERRIGKIYTSARFTCECGSRVLELLYCQSCGESLLGGYVAQEHSKEFLLSTRAALHEVLTGPLPVAQPPTTASTGRPADGPWSPSLGPDRGGACPTTPRRPPTP